MSSRPESEERVRYRRFTARPTDDRVLAKILLVLGSLVGIGAVALVLHTSMSSRPTSAEPAREVTQEADPGNIYTPDEQRLIEVTSSLVTKNQSVVIFSNGTCVLVKEPTSDPVSTARGMMLIAFSQEQLPVITSVEGGHLLATHHAPVYHYFFSGDLESLDLEINPSVETPEEESEIRQAMVSELALEQLKKDAGNSKPIKVLKAKMTSP